MERGRLGGHGLWAAQEMWAGGRKAEAGVCCRARAETLNSAFPSDTWSPQ